LKGNGVAGSEAYVGGAAVADLDVLPLHAGVYKGALTGLGTHQIERAVRVDTIAVKPRPEHHNVSHALVILKLLAGERQGSLKVR